MVSLVFSLLSVCLLSLSSAFPLSDTRPSLDNAGQPVKREHFQLLVSNSTDASLNGQTIQTNNHKFFIGKPFALNCTTSADGSCPASAPNDTMFTRTSRAPFIELEGGVGQFVGVLATCELFTIRSGAPSPTDLYKPSVPKEERGNIALNFELLDVNATWPGATGKILSLPGVESEWYTCTVEGEAATTRQIFVNVSDRLPNPENCERFVPAVKFLESS